MGPICRSPNTLPFLSPTVELRQTWLHPPPEIPVPAALPSLPQSFVRGLVPPTPLSRARQSSLRRCYSRSTLHRSKHPSTPSGALPYTAAASARPCRSELCPVAAWPKLRLRLLHAVSNSTSTNAGCAPPNPTPPELVTGSRELRGEKMVLEGA